MRKSGIVIEDKFGRHFLESTNTCSLRSKDPSWWSSQRFLWAFSVNLNGSFSSCDTVVRTAFTVGHGEVPARFRFRGMHSGVSSFGEKSEY
jgi:hypothetical protein